ncbi:MAG: metalloregulator ArsR/SmtB family transcription factor [Dehalococcoidia bacterium]|nr:metalloregulator ArsR/SmtB family transcription factor [Dehalococcoidia bacterium]
MTTAVRTTEQTGGPCCGIAEVHVHEDDGLDAAAAVFKALADGTRLRILRSISQMRELCECNIVPAFGLSQPTISYHLKVLRESGLIQSERRGQWVYHRVDPRALLAAVRRLTEIS